MVWSLLPLSFFVGAIAVLVVAYLAVVVHRSPSAFRPWAQRIAYRIYQDHSESMLVFGAAVLVVLGIVAALPQLEPIAYAPTLAIFLIGFVLTLLITRRSVGLMVGIPLVAVVVIVSSVLFVDPYRDKILDLMGQLREFKLGSLDVALDENRASQNDKDKFTLEQEVQRNYVAQVLRTDSKTSPGSYIWVMENDAQLIQARLADCDKQGDECSQTGSDRKTTYKTELELASHDLTKTRALVKAWYDRNEKIKESTNVSGKYAGVSEATEAVKVTEKALCDFESTVRQDFVAKKVSYTYIIDALLHINLAWTYRDSGVAEVVPIGCPIPPVPQKGEELARWHEYKAFAELLWALSRGPEPYSVSNDLLPDLWALNLHYVLGQVSIATYNARDVSLEANIRALSVARELLKIVHDLPAESFAQGGQIRFMKRFDRANRYLENAIANRWALRRDPQEEVVAREYSRDAACDFPDVDLLKLLSKSKDLLKLLSKLKGEESGMPQSQQIPLTCPDKDMPPSFLDTRGVVLLNYAIMHLTDDPVVLREDRVHYRQDISRALAFFDKALDMLEAEQRTSPDGDLSSIQITLVRRHQAVAKRALAGL